jgi:carbonic anhydrase/acetyltransferase-like protein (isoleucine patch superfamily)
MMLGKNFAATSGVRADPACFIHPSAQLYGDVRIGPRASIWPNVVMRAEVQHIEIGEGANIQDFAMIHIGYQTPTIIGAWCSITHHVTAHGCTIGADCLIGINATIMDGAVIGENTIVAGHAFVREGAVIPPNSIVIGAPASVKTSRNNQRANRLNGVLYAQNAAAYAQGEFRVWARPGNFDAAMDEVRAMLGAE